MLHNVTQYCIHKYPQTVVTAVGDAVTLPFLAFIILLTFTL